MGSANSGADPNAEADLHPKADPNAVAYLHPVAYLHAEATGNRHQHASTSEGRHVNTAQHYPESTEGHGWAA